MHCRTLCHIGTRREPSEIERFGTAIAEEARANVFAATFSFFDTTGAGEAAALASSLSLLALPSTASAMG